MIKCRLLTLSEAKDRITKYLVRQRDTNQAETLRLYGQELNTNYDPVNAKVTLFESSSSLDYNRSYDFNDYETRFIHITIEDNGSGIQKQQQSKLFQLFSNTKMSDQKVNQAGLGLGLTVSHMICKHMGGNLSLVNSQEGFGTKFSIMIPVLLKIMPDDFNDDSQLNEDLSMIHQLNMSSEHFVNSENISPLASRNALLPNFYLNN